MNTYTPFGYLQTVKNVCLIRIPHVAGVIKMLKKKKQTRLHSKNKERIYTREARAQQ